MIDTRNLAWRLNWYRQSELEGAMLLGRAIRAATDPDLVLSLTRHCADEARHSFQFAQALSELGLPIIQIFRSYQSFYAGQGALPTSLTQMLALTHVFEHRVDQQFHGELQSPDLPEPAARTFRSLLRDEQDHLHWIAKWLQAQPDASQLLDRYRQADIAVYAQVQPFAHRVWDIPGLGQEPHGASFTLLPQTTHHPD